MEVEIVVKGSVRIDLFRRRVRGAWGWALGSCCGINGLKRRKGSVVEIKVLAVVAAMVDGRTR